MATLTDILMRGNRGDQPAAATVPIGALYVVEDEDYIIEQNTGSEWVQFGRDATVTPHAEEHAEGGGDELSLLDLAGFTADPLDVLLGDGTFGLPTLEVEDLDNVAIEEPEDGEVLAYMMGAWVNAPAGGASASDADPTALDGAAGAGVSADFSRADHKHADANRPTTDQKAALAGSVGTPGAANVFVTATDPRVAWLSVIKTGDTARNNNTIAADPDLVVAMLANTKYVLEGVIYFDTGGTPDFKWRHAGPASPTRVRVCREHQVGGSGTRSNAAVETAYSGSDITLTGTGANGMIAFTAIIENGANAGNFEFQWAQNTTDAVTAATVLAGSRIRYRSF